MISWRFPHPLTPSRKGRGSKMLSRPGRGKLNVLPSRKRRGNIKPLFKEAFGFLAPPLFIDGVGLGI